MVGAEEEAEFRRMVAALALNFNKALTPRLVDLLYSGLADVPMKTMKAAFRRALETCKFFPTVAELRELAAEEVLAVDWEAAKALPAKTEWDYRVPEVGEFRKFLEALVEQKSVKGGKKR